MSELIENIEQLKPCPFCGRTPFIQRPERRKECAQVVCICGTYVFDVEMRNGPAPDEWNSRPIEDALTAENAQLRAELAASNHERAVYGDKLTGRICDLEIELGAMREAAKWIPVGERLPEVSRHVSNYFQVATKNPTNGYKYVDEACYVPEDWTVDDGFTYKAGWYRHNTATPIIGIDITHWRQLPTPPEAE